MGTSAQFVAFAAFLCLSGPAAGTGHAENAILGDDTTHQGSRHPAFSGGRPTLHAEENFDAQQDADQLRSALGNQIDENQILNILTKRTNLQRQEIISLYPNLENDLHDKLTFRFKDLMHSLTIFMPNYYAQQLNQAINLADTIDEDVLVELLGTLSNSEIHAVRDAYQTTYGRPLINDLAQNPYNRFVKFLSIFTKGKRDERNGVDIDLAIRDAQALKRSGQLRLEKSRKSPFGKILASRSFPQLRQTFMEYKRIAGRTIDEAIAISFSGNVQTGLLNIVKVIRDRPSYFAERLSNGMANSSAKDSTLIRIILTHCEVDMEDIKDAYNTMYGKSLSSSISDTTQGDYKTALLSLIGDYNVLRKK